MNSLEELNMKIYKFFTFICLISIAVTVFGQDSSSDKAKRAEKLALEGINLVSNNTPEAVKSAIPKLEEAEKLFNELGDKGMQAYCLFFLGNIYNSQGEKRKALDYFEKGLPIFKQGGNKEIEGGALMLVATIYDELGEQQKAINYFEEALTINRESNSKLGEAAILLKLGTVYSSLEQHENAVNSLSKALILFTDLDNKEAEIGVLKGIADSYLSLGESEMALKYYNDALFLNRTLGKKTGESAMLNNIGMLYSSLGESENALKYYNNSLSISRGLKNQNEEAYALINISEVYLNLGKKQEAFAHADKALEILNASKDNRGQAAALHNIAFVYSFLGDKKKALDYLNQSLQIRQSIGDKAGEAITLSGIGTIYSDMGDQQKAIDYYTQALPILRAIKDKGKEAMTFTNLVGVFILKNPRLAIFFGKKAINNHQNLRRAIQGLDTEVQKSYLRQSQLPYQALTEILLSQNRIPEVFQVINAEKNQQNFDIIVDSKRQVKSLTFTTSEEKFSKLYEEAADKVGNIAERIEKFKRELSPRQPNPMEIQTLRGIEAQLKTASDEFINVIKQAEVELAKPVDKNAPLPEIKELVEMQETLRNLNSQTGEKIAAVYTIFTKEKLVEVIITPDKVSSVFTIIEGRNLHNKAKEFAESIKTLDSENKPKIDVTDQAKELYNIIFKPVEAELPKDITTIMWALSDNLRYIPINALHDGKDYLIRRKLNNVVFTRLDPERLTRLLNPVWNATGFANSAARKGVKNLDTSYDFPELVAVEEEINGIIKKPGSKEGFLNGEVFSNQSFTKEAMLSALKKKNPVVHISSHFTVKSGDIARSFLLLGDGTSFPLSDMRKEIRLFEGVDLLTLSACNTAMDEPNSFGQEVDGFAELSQRLGAASVMATLWSVNECSTAEFMKLFYRNKVVGKMTKAEAIRQAQLAMLDGNSNIMNKVCRVNRKDESLETTEPKSVKKFKAYKGNPSKPFEHPYYWSPFVLYGNWK